MSEDRPRLIAERFNGGIVFSHADRAVWLDADTCIVTDDDECVHPDHPTATSECAR